MKIQLGQINLTLYFIDMNEAEVNSMEELEVLDQMNYKGSSFEIYMANSMFDDLVNYVKSCIKEKTDPVKTLFFVTNKKCFESYENYLQKTGYWKYIRVERADAHGYPLKKIKAFSEKYKNIVFTNFYTINEFVDATHYARNFRQKLILMKKFAKAIQKQALKLNVSLTFGLLLPQTSWYDRNIDDTKKKYSHSKEYPFDNISINFVYINEDDSEKVVTSVYKESKLQDEYKNAVPNYITKKVTVKEEKPKEQKPQVKEDWLDTFDFKKPW